MSKFHAIWEYWRESLRSKEKRDFNVRNRIESVHIRTDKEVHDAVLYPLSSDHDFAKIDEA